MQNRRKLMHINQENDIKPHFGPFLAQNCPFLGQHIFFSKIQKRHFSRLISGYLDAKNQKKLMAGNMRTCVTDGKVVSNLATSSLEVKLSAIPKNAFW